MLCICTFRSAYITLSQFCTNPTARNFSCTYYFIPRWLTSPTPCQIDTSYWVMMIMALLKRSKIILVSLKHLLPESEHWHIGFPRCVSELLVSFELKHDFLDEFHHSNNFLVMLNEFLFAIPPHIREKTISSLSVNNFECPFHILFQNFLSVKNKFCVHI